jgi:aminopeptidase YwaD
MLEETFSKISEEASAERAFDHLVRVSQFHRIQASPGFRAAAEYCVDRMLEVSRHARIIHYPADSKVKFWGFPSFEEWEGKRGEFRILSPDGLAGKYADFEACPISLIQRSKPTPPGGLTAELVYVGEGKNVGDYRRAKGKIAICDAHCPRDVYKAATGAGVAGILLYRHRPLPPLRKGLGVEGVRQYNSFWWNEKDLFGFVLTPEDGHRIVSYLTSKEAAKRPVRANALVDGETHPGSLEVVTSLIQGTESREIVVIAHLCHPKPSAGDNASGVAALLEAHRLLCSLIEKGDLPQPRYGIRFLLVPEVTGTFAYLSRTRGARGRMLFGLNLDMVGQRQEVTGSTLCVESPPLAAPSFTPYLLQSVVRKAFSQGTNPASTGTLVSIRMQSTPFSGGSDHFILSDPTVGVPTPMLIQWPDKYYHTSGDTQDKVSPDVLCRVAAAASVYAYTCALAAEEDMMALSALTGRGLRKWIIDELAGFAASRDRIGVGPQDKGRFLLAIGKQALRSIQKLLPHSAELRSHLRREERALTRCIKEEVRILETRWDASRWPRRSRRPMADQQAAAIVKRTLPGPVDMGAVLMELGKSRRAQYGRWMVREKRSQMIQTLALYWANGNRSIAEISQLVALEMGYTNLSFLKFYFRLLEDAGVIRLK